jgi:hypothetical protein
MSLNTEPTRPQTPSNRSLHKGDYDTVRRVRFYEECDRASPSRSRSSLALDFAPSRRTGLRWLKERDQLGDIAMRSLRKRSNRLGRPSKVTVDVCKMLVSPSRNPVRDQHYDAQIEYHKLPVKSRALRRQIKKHTNNAQRYKQSYVKKKLSATTRRKRVEYGEEHKDETVESLWQFVFFTDEAHFDPSSQQVGYILREEGLRNKPENIQERGQKEGNKLHVAGWINWHAKCDKLEFYNDEEEHEEQPKSPPKPRKSKYESADDYNKRLKVWEAEKPHKVEVKPKGNAMTQKYYTERLLPGLITAVSKQRIYGPATEDKGPANWLLQEDGDPSHGMKKDGLARQLKTDNWIENLTHPPVSPDLNPQEGVWNILKQRVRKRVWHGLEELKEVIQDEWDKITIEEVRKRIADMPRRCKLLVETNGHPIKGLLW